MVEELKCERGRGEIQNKLPYFLIPISMKTPEAQGPKSLKNQKHHGETNAG